MHRQKGGIFDNHDSGLPDTTIEAVTFLLLLKRIKRKRTITCTLFPHLLELMLVRGFAVVASCENA
jgi:hypothetical protein